MKNKTQWQELLKQYPGGMGSLEHCNKNQENLSANNQPDERKKKNKLRLGLIKG